MITVLCLVGNLSGADQEEHSDASGELSLPLSEYRDKLKGGFVGQMAGVTYGFPYEFKFQGFTVPEFLMHDWNPEMIRGSVGQDDIYVELTFLQTLEKHGLDVSMEQIGRDFGESRYPLWHANKYGRKNIREGIMPPLSGHPQYNAHADDIDFQIEADLFGLICPGMPVAAQDLAWKFGHVMNYGDGVYGGVFIGAMYSAAFFETDRVKVVEAGLAAIPAESNYAKTIMDVLDQFKKDPDDWKAAWQLIEDKWVPKVHCTDRHPLDIWRHLGIGANTNGAYVVIGLLYGDGDPFETMKIATMCGLDADCNPASAMGVLGTMIGFENLPESFKPALPSMVGNEFAYTEYDWEGAIKAMEDVAKKVLESRGGRVESGSQGNVWIIPAEVPKSLPLEQWEYDVPGAEVPLP
jgi:hypothetical protein